MVLKEYENIKQSVIQCISTHHNPEEVVTRLKTLFKSDINSLRTSDRIKTIENLLYVLETRDIISEDNISRLKYDIVPFLQCEICGDVILRNAHNYNPATQQKSEDGTQSLNKTFMTFKLNNFMSEKKIERINNAILNHIGTHWKDLARNLRLQEGKIDQIEMASISPKDKAIEVLKEYERIADPQKWVFVLCEALNKSRRRDISKNIMDIFTMYI